MSNCPRPRVVPVHIAGRDLRRCEACGWCSPPFDQDAWESWHRGEVAA